MRVKTKGKLLGRIYMQRSHKHGLYVKKAKRAATAASRMLAWLGAYQDTASLQLAEYLFVTLVQSVLVPNIVTCQLNNKDYTELRATQCKICRRAAMAGKRVSQYIILRETGWTPIDAPIICAKLGLYERIKKQDTREYAATVLAERQEAVREGDTKGLCYEVRELWRKLGAAERWDGTPSENAQDKQERKW